MNQESSHRPPPSGREQVDDTKYVGIVALGLFTAMFLLAFALPGEMDPETLSDLRSFFRHWLPNIHKISLKSSDPALVELYVISAVLAAGAAFGIFLVGRPGDRGMRPLYSHMKKWVALVAFAFIGVGYSAILWRPGGADFEIGLLAGRWGAFMYVALSSRLGMSLLLNLFFCLGPFFIMSFMLMILSKPVRKLGR